MSLRLISKSFITPGQFISPPSHASCLNILSTAILCTILTSTESYVMINTGSGRNANAKPQLLSTIEEIASTTAKGHQGDIILLDFMKAFDKVPHTRLLHKLDHYGVRENVKNWKESFLSHREQILVLDQVRSPLIVIVNQGCTLYIWGWRMKAYK